MVGTEVEKVNWMWLRDEVINGRFCVNTYMFVGFDTHSFVWLCTWSCVCSQWQWCYSGLLFVNFI